jgi:hypothetical protein
VQRVYDSMLDANPAAAPQLSLEEVIPPPESSGARCLRFGNEERDTSVHDTGGWGGGERGGGGASTEGTPPGVSLPRNPTPSSARATASGAGGGGGGGSGGRSGGNINSRRGSAGLRVDVKTLTPDAKTRSMDSGRGGGGGGSGRGHGAALCRPSGVVTDALCVDSRLTARDWSQHWDPTQPLIRSPAFTHLCFPTLLLQSLYELCVATADRFAFIVSLH